MDLNKGRVIRPVQTNYGIALCGENFVVNSEEINERKFQKALQVIRGLLLWVLQIPKNSIL